MAYSTLADIKNVVPEASIVQLTDDVGTGTVDQAKVDKAIADADELIDSFLRGQYATPLSPVPGVVNKLSVDIAVFNLYSRRPEAEMPETVLVRYREAVRLLERIQRGLALLGTPSEQSAESPQYKVSKTAEDKVFDGALLDKFFSL